VGFGAGTAITHPWEAKLIKAHFGMSASKNALKYSETTLGPGYLFREAKMSPLPGISGQAAGATLQESVGNSLQNKINGGLSYEK
jgi:filamentous hemagglutinin